MFLGLDPTQPGQSLSPRSSLFPGVSPPIVAPPATTSGPCHSHCESPKTRGLSPGRSFLEKVWPSGRDQDPYSRQQGTGEKHRLGLAGPLQIVECKDTGTYSVRDSDMASPRSPFYGEDFYCEIPRSFRHLAFYIFDRDVFRRDSIIGMMHAAPCVWHSAPPDPPCAGSPRVSTDSSCSAFAGWPRAKRPQPRMVGSQCWALTLLTAWVLRAT